MAIYLGATPITRESEPIKNQDLLHVVDWFDLANSIDRSGFAAYTPLQPFN